MARDPYNPFTDSGDPLPQESVRFAPEFLDTYREAIADESGAKIPKEVRVARKFSDYLLWWRENRVEDPIVPPGTPADEAMGLLVDAAIQTITPSELPKFRGQLLKLAGDAVLQERKRKVEAFETSKAMSVMALLLQRALADPSRRGPGWEQLNGAIPSAHDAAESAAAVLEMQGAEAQNA